MKNFLLRLALAVLLITGMIALTAPSNAEPSGPNPQPVMLQPISPPLPARPQAQPTGPQTQDAKPFNGTIMKENGKLILKDTVAKVSYQLDDQQRAKPFEGKQVKVTGKLDMDTNLIHIESIELLAS